MLEKRSDNNRKRTSAKGLKNPCEIKRVNITYLILDLGNQSSNIVQGFAFDISLVVNSLALC